MPKSRNQKIKLLYLMKIFEENTDDDHGLTMAEIIEKINAYGVQAERKSLYADMESLRLFGLDIEKRKGKTYEYYIANRKFELPELKLLVDAIQSSKFITHKKSAQLIKKLESLSSVHQAKQLQRQVVVTNRNKYMNESIYYNVDKIQQGILQDKMITFYYFEWVTSFGEEQKISKKTKKDGELYLVSPWALTWDDENYYLIGYDDRSGIVKHYRVDKMQQINCINEQRSGKKIFEAFDLGTYSKMTFGMFGGKAENIKLKMHNRLVGVLVDRFGTDVYIYKQDDDHFISEVNVIVSMQFFAWVFGLGQDVKILSPGHVVEQFAQHANNIARQYNIYSPPQSENDDD